MQFCDRLCISRCGNRRGLATGFSTLKIGSVIGLFAKDDAVFAIGRGDHEFVGSIPPDRAAFCFNRQEFQATSRKDPTVGAIHFLIDVVQRFQR